MVKNLTKILETKLSYPQDQIPSKKIYKSLSLPNLSLSESINYPGNLKPEIEKKIAKRKIKITNILLNKDPINVIIKIYPQDNYIAVFSDRSENITYNRNKKFSLIFSKLDENKKSMKTLSHPVGNFTFATDISKVLFISTRKKQDKIKMIEFINHNIDDSKKAISLNLKFKKSILKDISYSDNKCLALTARNNIASITECDISNKMPNKNYTWCENFSLMCPEIINNLKFSENNEFIFALLKHDKLAIYKKNTTEQKYSECKIISNITNMPLAVSDEKDILCYDNKELFIINCNSDQDLEDDTVDKIAEFTDTQIIAACFMKSDDIIISTKNTFKKINEILVYKKQNGYWQAINLDITKNIVDIKKNILNQKIYMFYNK